MGRVPTLLIALAAVATLAFGGCGDGGGGTTAPTTTDSGSRQGATTTPGQKAEKEGGAASNRDGGSSTGKTKPKEETSSSSHPAPQEGSKAAAPGVPTSKGGDNSIQTYGLEAGSEERAEAAAAVQEFLDARAAANWARACSLLAAQQRQLFEQLGKRSNGGGSTSCAEVMAAFASGVPSSAFAEEAEIAEVLSLRVGENAFLIYTRPDGEVYTTAIVREDGTWKVVSVGPTQIS